MQDDNRIVSVVHVCKRKEPLPKVLAGSHADKESLLASQIRASCVILHQEYAQELHPVTDGYPAACMPIAN